MTLNALNNTQLPVYGNGLQIRDWIHVEDHANGVLSAMLALYVGRISSGEVFNFGADNEQKNIDIVKKIISQTSASDSLINFVKDRPGHDKRYAMKYNKAEKVLGWKPEIDWNTGLLETIQWYTMNPDWVNSTK